MNDRNQAFFDPRIADWLEGDPNEAPDQSLQFVLAAFRSVKQRHGLRLRRKSSVMATGLKLAVGAVAIIAVVLVGGSILLTSTPVDIGRPAPTPSPGSSDLRSKIPKTIGDVVMSIAAPDADTHMRLNPSRRLAHVLTALGKTEASLEVATGKRAGATPLLAIDALRINGVPATAVLEAFETAVVDAPGISPSTNIVNGKEALTWDSGNFYTAVYAKDDVLYFVQSTDLDLVSRGLGALP